MTRALAYLEHEARRLAFRKNALVALVAVANVVAMWRTYGIDGAQRVSIELAWFTVSVCSALALALALEARDQLRDVEQVIRELRAARRRG
jgi:hypothetical protein